jgi:hypothetical protein
MSKRPGRKPKNESLEIVPPVILPTTDAPPKQRRQKKHVSSLKNKPEEVHKEVIEEEVHEEEVSKPVVECKIPEEVSNPVVECKIPEEVCEPIVECKDVCDPTEEYDIVNVLEHCGFTSLSSLVKGQQTLYVKAMSLRGEKVFILNDKNTFEKSLQSQNFSTELCVPVPAVIKSGYLRIINPSISGIGIECNQGTIILVREKTLDYSEMHFISNLNNDTTSFLIYPVVRFSDIETDPFTVSTNIHENTHLIQEHTQNTNDIYVDETLSMVDHMIQHGHRFHRLANELSSTVPLIDDTLQELNEALDYYLSLPVLTHEEEHLYSKVVLNLKLYNSIRETVVNNEQRVYAHKYFSMFETLLKDLHETHQYIEKISPIIGDVLEG